MRLAFCTRRGCVEQKVTWGREAVVCCDNHYRGWVGVIVRSDNPKRALWEVIVCCDNP